MADFQKILKTNPYHDAEGKFTSREKVGGKEGQALLKASGANGPEASNVRLSRNPSVAAQFVLNFDSTRSVKDQAEYMIKNGFKVDIFMLQSKDAAELKGPHGAQATVYSRKNGSLVSMTFFQDTGMGQGPAKHQGNPLYLD